MTYFVAKNIPFNPLGEDTMSYIQQNLMPGEQVVYQTKLHWMGLVNPIISLGLGVVVALFGLRLSNWVIKFVPDVSNLHDTLAALNKYEFIFWIIGGLWALSALVGLLSMISSMLTSEFALTNKRVVIKTGMIRRATTELLLAKIESINVEQSLFGRLFNYGTIIITGTGTTHEPFTNIANPLVFRQHVQEQIFATSQGQTV
jgi:uncharacterized membrane protein YdbT with pleckstrin-like domain